MTPQQNQYAIIFCAGWLVMNKRLMGEDEYKNCSVLLNAEYRRNKIALDTQKLR